MQRNELLRRKQRTWSVYPCWTACGVFEESDEYDRTNTETACNAFAASGVQADIEVCNDHSGEVDYGIASSVPAVNFSGDDITSRFA
jgi:hypothetical protein